MTEARDRPWTLAERFEEAHRMAKEGSSVREIIDLTGLTVKTAICIFNKHNPDAKAIKTLNRNTME